MITLAYLGVAAWEMLHFQMHWDSFSEMHCLISEYFMNCRVQSFTGMFLLIGVVGAVVMTVLNLAGAKSSAIFQTTATIAMAIGGIAFFVCGTATGDIENLKPMFTDGQGMVAVMAVPAMLKDST